MPKDTIPFRETNYFSDLICDYLDEKEELRQFYNRYPKIENFLDQINQKQSVFESINREVLVNSLNEQYKDIEVSPITSKNIKSLSKETTFTITTGHQLNLFTGPLYFFYKIISAINLCKDLKHSYPDFDFVPVYWMATEDHDFEEINFFNYQNQKVTWSKNAAGAVGELDLNGLENVYKTFEKKLGVSKNAQELRLLFKTAYLDHNTLTEAMRYLVNELFSEYGLVILDGNDKRLKSLFIPYIKDEILNKTSFKSVSKTNEKIKSLNKDYSIQVNPREINLFYLKDGVRERIVEKDNRFIALNSDFSWSKSELLDLVDQYPECFSPNVILRPLFQEIVLPNLCYIGGGGELAYWFQLKSNFESNNIPFPILLLRNSVLVATQKQRTKLSKLNLEMSDLFLKQTELVSKVTKQVSSIEIDLSVQKEHLKLQFKELYELANQTDKSFLGAISAQERKQIKGIEHLEKRLLKAQKRKHHDLLTRVNSLQNELFPNGSLQERNDNFSEFYIEYGKQFIQLLAANLNPLKAEYFILNLN